MGWLTDATKHAAQDRAQLGACDAIPAHQFVFGEMVREFSVESLLSNPEIDRLAVITLCGIRFVVESLS